MICCCIRCWRVCTSLTISPSSWALSSSLRFFRAYTGRRYGEGPPVARPLRLESWGWSGQPQLIPKPLIRGILHVADSDLPPWPGTLHLGEVHAKFLGLTLGGLRGVGFFLPAALSGILGLLGGLTRGVLGALHGLPSLICHLAQGVLSFLALLLRTGVGLVAGLLGGLGGLGRRRYLQVENASVLPQLQADQRSRLVGHGGRLVALFVGGLLVAFGRRQVGGAAHRTLVYNVALLIEDHFDQVAFLVNGALDGMAFLVGGGLAERLGARGEAPYHFADLVHRASRGVLNLVSGLAGGVLHLPGDLPNLICHSS